LVGDGGAIGLAFPDQHIQDRVEGGINVEPPPAAVIVQVGAAVLYTPGPLKS
jgi:hypothetical protein